MAETKVDKISLKQLEAEMAKGIPQKQAISNLAMKNNKKEK